MRTLLQRKMSHKCDAKAAREFRKRNSLVLITNESLVEQIRYAVVQYLVYGVNVMSARYDTLE